MLSVYNTYVIFVTSNDEQVKGWASLGRRHVAYMVSGQYCVIEWKDR
jgi:hypothetical protein